MYFALEEILTEWCGEYRVGNLFCLRAIDAPAIVSWTKRFIRNDGQGHLPEVLHYAALNTNPLKKFGSLELRQLRGTTDPDVIETWVRLLQRMYELSKDFPDPREICTMVSSGGGPLVFFETVLGELASVVKNGIGYNEQDIRDSIYVGIRLAQDICYCRDWSLYKPMPLKPDPFNRNMKKVAQKVMGMSGVPYYEEQIMQQASVSPFPPGDTEVAESEPEPDYDDFPQEMPDWEV